MAVIGLFALLLFDLLFPAGAAARIDYGNWWPQPGSRPNAQQFSVYQADIAPFNAEDVHEMVNIGCVLRDGTVLTEKEEELLRTTFQEAGRVFSGKFEWVKKEGSASALSQLREGRDPRVTANGGYRADRVGMRHFLEDMLTLIRLKEWAPPSQHIELVGEPKDEDSEYTYLVHPGRKPYLWIDVDNDKANPYDIHDSRRRQMIMRMIEANLDAASPIQLYTGTGDGKGIPTGCDLGGYVPEDPLGGGILGFLDDLGDNVINMIGYLPAYAFGKIYDVSYEPALRYNFFTPHSERGDTIFNVATSCAPGRDADQLKMVNRSCYRGEPLGFDRMRRDGMERPAWLGVRDLLQWLVSGFYFLLLFSAAVVFIFRGTASKTFNVLRMIPRLLLSVLFTVFSAFIIGALISTSNMLVKAMFDPADFANLSAINAVFQSPSIVAGQSWAGNIFDAVIITPAGLFMAGLTILAFVRQILLVILVLLAPLASFCLIIDSWRQHFNRWLTGLLTVIALPVVLGFIFTIGIRINPLITTPSSYGTMLGMIGLFLMLGTLYLTFRVGRSTLAAAANSKVVGMSGTGALAGWGASKLGGGKLAGMLGAYSKATQASSNLGGRLVPAAKIAGRSQIGGGVADKALIGSTKLGTKTALGAWRFGRQAASGQLSINGPADRIRAFKARRELKRAGGYELHGDHTQQLLGYAQRASGLDAKRWARLDSSVKADWVKYVGGYESAHLGEDGRLFVRESAEQQQMKTAGARAAARAMIHGGNPVTVVDPSSADVPPPPPGAGGGAAVPDGVPDIQPFANAGGYTPDEIDDAYEAIASDSFEDANPAGFDAAERSAEAAERSADAVERSAEAAERSADAVEQAAQDARRRLAE